MAGGSQGLRLGSGGDRNNNNDDDERNRNEPPESKRTYHRHTPRQIQKMEALFRECPHPDDKQRLQLSEELGLKPHQVKFWFQNRRTQLKAQMDRGDNLILRTQNEALRNENIRLQAAMEKVVCPHCNSPAALGEMSSDEQRLRVENVRLKDELQRLSELIGLCDSAPQPQPQPQPQQLDTEPRQLPQLSLDLDMGSYSRQLGSSSVMGGAEDLIQVPHNGAAQDSTPLAAMSMEQTLVFELAMTAADQLLKLCSTKEPLWVRSSGSCKDSLDLAEHARILPWPVELKQNPQHGQVRTEASRDAAVVMMSSIALVDSFFDPDKWIELFPSIVAKAETVNVLSPGVSNQRNGRLHLMRAELHFPSPLVPTRQAHFFRYCQQNSEANMWIVVDFPVDNFHDVVQATSLTSCWFRRRTSGCVVQDMLNGFSKVLWVEHVEVEEKPVHTIFNQFVRSGEAFGATRWVSTLQRQCERQASIITSNASDSGVLQSTEARKNLVKLSQRMLRTFGANIISSETQSWTALSNARDDTIRVTTRASTDPGQPNGVILAATSTARVPFPHEQVFNLLTDGNIWSQLDVLLNGSSLHEMVHVANGSHAKNCLSLLQVNNGAMDSSQNLQFLLKESSTHPTGGSFVLYATVDINAICAAITGQDPPCVSLLPAGFLIMPSTSPSQHAVSSSSGAGAGARPSTAEGGSLLTIGVQILTNSSPSAPLDLQTVTAICSHVGKTMQQIITMLGCTLSEPSSSPSSDGYYSL